MDKAPVALQYRKLVIGVFQHSLKALVIYHLAGGWGASQRLNGRWIQQSDLERRESNNQTIE
jgi:hypothetical protein